MTSLANLRTRLSEDYTRDPNYRVWNQATVERAINKGYTKVQQDLGRSEPTSEKYSTTSTVIGDELYGLPEGFVRMKLLRYNGTALTETTRKQIRIEDSTTASGTPHSYYLYGGDLGVYPVPDSVGTLGIEYYKSQNTLTSSQNTTLPSFCDDATLLYAAYKLFLGVRDQNSASLFLQDYQQEINRLLTTLLMNDENIRFGYEYVGNATRSDVLDNNIF